MLEKIFFAINQKNFEDLIEQGAKDCAVVVGHTIYAEGIFNQLPSSGATVLILIESLAGGMTTEEIIKTVRRDYPRIRIILITGESEKAKALIKFAVSLGVHDIASSDNLWYEDIVEMIRQPKTISDVWKYVEPQELAAEEEETPKRKSFLPHIPSFVKTMKPAAETPVKPKDSIKEEASRLVSEENRVLQEEKANLQQLLREKDEQLREMSRKLHAAESKPTVSGSNDARIRELETALKDTQFKLKNSEEKIEALSKSAGGETPDSTTELKHLSSEIENLKREKEILQLEKNSLTEDKGSLLKEKESLLQENRELKTKDSNHQSDIERIRKEYEGRITSLDISLRSSDIKISEERNNAAAEKRSREAAEESLRQANLSLEEKTAEIERLNLDIEKIKESSKEEELTEELKKLEIEKDSLKSQVEDLLGTAREREAIIESLRLSLDNTEMKDLLAENEALRKALDDTKEEDISIEPEDFTFAGKSRIIALLSAKDGDGATSTALTLGTKLAQSGEKTIIVEFSMNASLANYFDLSNIPAGITEAVSALSSGQVRTADAAITRFAGMKTSREIKRAYSKLPAGLHIMTLSNSERLHTEPKRYTPQEIHLLCRYLSETQKYANVILDIPGSESQLIAAAFGSGDINRLVICMTQSKTSIMQCKSLIQRISRLGYGALVSSGYYVINRHSTSGESYSSIAAAIGLPRRRDFYIPADVTGYLEAEKQHLPYPIYGGRLAKPLKDIEKIVK